MNIGALGQAKSWSDLVSINGARLAANHGKVIREIPRSAHKQGGYFGFPVEAKPNGCLEM